MNADAFRHIYDYHFAENRSIWDTHVISLSQEQFMQDVNYSHGSVRNQIVHLMNVDNTWFSPLLGEEPSEWLDPADFEDRKVIRGEWDKVEQKMRGYLANLRDDMLLEKPYPDHEEDKVLILWQVLLHVVNHGTDHRATAQIIQRSGYQDRAAGFRFGDYPLIARI
jgi:uncharacterized damage-inducible protein DinB